MKAMRKNLSAGSLLRQQLSPPCGFLRGFASLVKPVLSASILFKPALLACTTVLLLSSCAIQPPAPIEPIPPQTPAEPSTEPLPPVPALPENPDALLTTPKIHDYDWQDAVAPMVSNLMQSHTATAGSLLLISNLNNRTNGSLPVDTATAAIRDALAGNPTFSVVSAGQEDAARARLGLSAGDRLATRGKALAIARSAGAQYVLYTTASGDVNTPALQMQLLLVQSGEIVWTATASLSSQ